MPISSKLERFLDDNDVRYVVTTHSPAFTAQEIAALAHVKGRELVKSVMVKVDGKHCLVAMTANQRLNLDRLRTALGTSDVHLEREAEFRSLFPDCELGAMPPFGNLYGVPVVIDEALQADEEIAFNGGDHSTIVKMRFADFERLVRPRASSVADRI
jgi:Ala-tRNA(Pro) deacylase